ncbi:hypothetical protein, partial [Marinobacter sp.]|uniref:hypothetical protein n=1 Tax=Marinobacter sp. TaxID=50741 RepID=UPI003A8FCAA5
MNAPEVHESTKKSAGFPDVQQSDSDRFEFVPALDISTPYAVIKHYGEGATCEKIDDVPKYRVLSDWTAVHSREFEGRISALPFFSPIGSLSAKEAKTFLLEYRLIIECEKKSLSWKRSELSKLETDAQLSDAWEQFESKFGTGNLHAQIADWIELQESASHQDYSASRLLDKFLHSLTKKRDLTGGLGAATIAIFGVIVSILSVGVITALIEAFRNQTLPSSTTATESLFFVIAIIMLIRFIYGREQQVKTKADCARLIYQARQLAIARAHREVHVRQQDLLTLLATMPPPQALDIFTQAFRRIRIIHVDLAKPVDKPSEALLESLEENIRRTLWALSRLFLQYQHKPQAKRCSAHIALWVDREKLENSCKLKSLLKFVENDSAKLQGLAGALHVDPKLSAFCSGSMIPDTNVGGNIATISEVSDDQ